MSNLSLIPQESEWRQLKEICQIGVSSGFLPTAIKTPQQAAIIALKGRELGIPPMQAFSSIAVIQGKPTMGAELMLSLIYKNCPGAVVNFVEVSDERCVLEAKRPTKESKFTTFKFSLDDAKKAGLLSKDSWQKYPRAMLKARAITEMARTIFPDAISGVSYTPEELGAEVAMTDDGIVEVVSVKPTAQSIPNLAPKPKDVSPEPQKEAVNLETGEVTEDVDLDEIEEALNSAERELDQMALIKMQKDEPREPKKEEVRAKRKYNGPNPHRGNTSPANAEDLNLMTSTAKLKKFTESQLSTAYKKLTGKASQSELTREDAWDVIGFLSTKTIHDLALMK